MSRDITAVAPVPADGRERYGDAPSQFFDFWRPKLRSLGTVVFIHGGFWRVKYDLLHGSHLCAALADAGFSVASLEYRRVGERGGGWPGSLDDVLLGTNLARRFLGEAKPLVVGHSAGGHLALRLASETPDVCGVVALAPVADLQLAHERNLSNGAVGEFLGADPSKCPELLTAACASRHSAAVPRVIVHGTTDDIVPIELSRHYIQLRSKDQPAPQLIEIAGADHFDLIDPESSAWPVVRDSVLQIACSPRS